MISSCPVPPRPRSPWARRGDQLLVLLGDLLQDAVELMVPQACASCGQGNRAVCRVCRLLFTGFTMDPREVSATARHLPEGLVAWAAGGYRHEVARLVLAFKNGLRTDAAPLLARALARSLAAWEQAVLDQGVLGAGEEVLLVPVPSSAAAYRRRGFDPAELLLRRALASTGPGPFRYRVAAVLRRRRAEAFSSPSGQKGLGRTGRAARAHGSMLVAPRVLQRWCGGAPDLAGRACLLVDDVLTTGASLREAARVVQEAGGAVVGAVVLASVGAPDARPAGTP